MITINRDTIATFAIADLFLAPDLIPSIESCDNDLDAFLEICMIELRDADDLHLAMNPHDDDDRRTAINSILDNDYDFIIAEMRDTILNHYRYPNLLDKLSSI